MLQSQFIFSSSVLWETVQTDSGSAGSNLQQDDSYHMLSAKVVENVRVPKF